jgi:hypothetical protein
MRIPHPEQCRCRTQAGRLASSFPTACRRRGRYFRDRGIDVDFQPKLGPDKEKLLEVIGG